MKIIGNIIPTNLVRNLLLSSFCPFLQTKSKNLVFSKLVVCFLFIASRALLQSHTEFNGLLLMIFLAYFSCSYYSSMVESSNIALHNVTLKVNV